jgi:hypothetical protein
MAPDVRRLSPSAKPRLEIRRELLNSGTSHSTVPSLLVEEGDPLLHRIDIAIRCGEVRDVVLEPFGHEHLDERLVLRLLSGLAMRKVVRGECV